MNARTQQFEITVEDQQLEEALSCIFHTLLLHRSTGKFTYQADSNYTIGSVGTEDVDCSYIDLTYLRINSDELDAAVAVDISDFKNSLRTADRIPGTGAEQVRHGRVTLEFYQRKPRQWPLPGEDVVPWEQWHIYTQVVSCTSETDQRRMRELTADSLADVIYSIAGMVNRPQYVPKMPRKADIEHVFDVRFSDVQPYLFRITSEVVSQTSYGAGGGSRSFLEQMGGPTLSHTLKRLLKDTFAAK